jgi:hypothetical protein
MAGLQLAQLQGSFPVCLEYGLVLCGQLVQGVRSFEVLDLQRLLVSLQHHVIRLQPDSGITGGANTVLLTFLKSDILKSDRSSKRRVCLDPEDVNCTGELR